MSVLQGASYHDEYQFHPARIDPEPGTVHMTRVERSAAQSTAYLRNLLHWIVARRVKASLRPTPLFSLPSRGTDRIRDCIRWNATKRVLPFRAFEQVRQSQLIPHLSLRPMFCLTVTDEGHGEKRRELSKKYAQGSACGSMRTIAG